uniref:cation diffusion facilitator family transporter n=1 Tax=Eubacterium cellulosolvens TaxID=29322 RepID=UPI0004807A63|nr:cation diffusion facilitator family transporter [[Eubacterium] cellulosolvens]
MRKDGTVDSETIAMRISYTSIAVNVILTVFKLLAGLIAHSGAMVSDAVHSASDVVSTLIVIVGIRISSKESDGDHPYGHERFECVASVILSVMLGLTGLGIGSAGIRKIASGDPGNLTVPGKLALLAAVISVFLKEGMYWYTRAGAKKIRSTALMADAWHHRSDALSSVGSFAGILASRAGFPVMDPLASVLICGFILKAAFDIFRDAVGKMTDHATSPEQQKMIRETIERVEGVIRIDELKTRTFGSRIYVDVEIGVQGDLPLVEAHAIAEEVHDRIESEFPEVKHCMVHENPV